MTQRNEWKGSGGKRGSPETCWTLTIPWVAICVHRHIHYEPDQWLLSCVQAGVSDHELQSKGLEDAKAEAVEFVRERFVEYLHSITTNASTLKELKLARAAK